ncbi:MAG: hypothetical protein IKJ84_01800 [Oscillospiraceae bacterium]|nr:hypothetical protein [Oscillospiraceae bacterium]
MKIAKFFSWIFGLLGAVVMAGTVVLCLFSLNREPVVQEVPREAKECVQEVMDAIGSGDFTLASRYFYGQPDLGADRKPESEAGTMVWDAFVRSISYEVKSDCYATDTGLAVDVAVTAMDIPSVTEVLTQKAHTLLTHRVESATDMEELYDENNEFREDLVEDVLREAVVRALAEDAQPVTRDVTLHLIHRDGQWWIQPDSALLEVLSGGVA